MLKRKHRPDSNVSSSSSSLASSRSAEYTGMSSSLSEPSFKQPATPVPKERHHGYERGPVAAEAMRAQSEPPDRPCEFFSISFFNPFSVWVKGAWWPSPRFNPRLQPFLQLSLWWFKQSHTNSWSLFSLFTVPTFEWDIKPRPRVNRLTGAGLLN